ncbi:hypothetical protein GPECTOR_31g402 [Gonium pectorale]|uniref:RRM domain-containing protein n=1 Tax=Gonium pectorale TaxID=33097 RepID=A0A150GE00_GONPE|nr:hypothetical protein GPECTOR_31g402 [Gonium pectorale]|eukprot:KXZ48038.1 hypothetical protein GPECTOR_31g402 [Gonium pectorale]
MGDSGDYPPEHDLIEQQAHGREGGGPRGGGDARDRERSRDRERHEREPPRDFERRRGRSGEQRDRRDDEPPRRDRSGDRGPSTGRDYGDYRDDDRPRRDRDRGDDRFERGPSSGSRDYRDDRRDVRSDSRDYGRDRRRSRSRDRRRSRSPRDRYDSRRDDRHRDRDRDRDRDWERDRDRDRERDRDRDWDRGRERDRDRERERGGGRGGRGAGGGRRGGDHSEEEEGYGGYRPRKRQVPPDPSKYDKPLPPGAGPGYIQDPYYYLRQNVPTDPAEAQRLWIEQQLRSRSMVLQQQAASAAAASAKTQRELYIGNLVPGAVTDVALRQLFNTTLAAAFPAAAAPGNEPVVNVNLHSDGRYAFVEFRTPEMATAALALNAQVTLLGQTISVGRPSGYVDPSKAATAAQASAQALAAFQAGDMEGLASYAAAAGMNLAQLGLANMPVKAPAGGAAAAEAAGQAPAAAPAADGAAAAVVHPQVVEAATQPVEAAAQVAEAAVNGRVHVAAEAAGVDAAASAAASGGPTPFFCVENMLAADMLRDDEEYEAVIEDLTEECSRTAPGAVLGVKVPRPPPELRHSDAFMGTANYGKAYLSFRDAASAQRARDTIHGRLFAGSTVTVRFIDQAEYDSA